MKKITTDEIWDITVKSIRVGYNRLQRETWMEMLLKGTDLKQMRQLRNAVWVIDNCKKPLKLSKKEKLKIIEKESNKLEHKYSMPMAIDWEDVYDDGNNECLDVSLELAYKSMNRLLRILNHICKR